MALAFFLSSSSVSVLDTDANLASRAFFLDACFLCVCASSEIWAICLKKRVVGRHPWTRATSCLLNLWTMHAEGHPHECLVSFPPKSLQSQSLSTWQLACQSSNHAYCIYLFLVVRGTLNWLMPWTLIGWESSMDPRYMDNLENNTFSFVLLQWKKKLWTKRRTSLCRTSVAPSTTSIASLSCQWLATRSTSCMHGHALVCLPMSWLINCCSYPASPFPRCHSQCTTIVPLCQLAIHWSAT